MIRYQVGDATQPTSDGVCVIVHVCNDLGAWGAGFVLAVSRRWKQPERFYRESFQTSSPPRLGDVQLVTVAPALLVANLIAQDGFPSCERQVAIDYRALETCLETLASYASPGWSFHMPRIGCGLAGGKWEDVESVVQRTLGLFPVEVYDLAAPVELGGAS